MSASKIETQKLRCAVLATDVVALSFIDGVLSVLLVPITLPECKGKLGMPGGLIRPEETAEEAAARVVSAKGGVSGGYREQLATFSKVNRDPRGRVVSVAYLTLMSPQTKLETETGAKWIAISKAGKLAYDHTEILDAAIERLTGKLSYTNIAQHLLPPTFTLTELQSLYESIIGATLDKRNFRKKVLAVDLVVKTGARRSGDANRPAELYKFKRTTLQIIEIL